MTWNADTLTTPIIEPGLLEDLVTVLDDLTEADRSATRTTLDKTIPSLRQHPGKNEEWEHLPLLATTIGAIPAQCVSVFALQEIWRLKRSPVVTRNRLISWLTGNGPDWASGFVTRLLRRRDDADIHALIDELAIVHGLPTPDGPAFLTAWAMKNTIHPRSERCWKEHFIATCATLNAFIQHLDSGQHTQFQEVIADLRMARPTNDNALPLALLQVSERGDSRPSQQFALIPIAGLDLTPLLVEHSNRLLAALPNAGPVVMKFAVEQLLSPGLSEDHLTTLALDVLVRKEKDIKHAVSGALRSANDPSQGLVEILVTITADPDSTAAGLAQEPFDDWGAATRLAESLELWHDPLSTLPESVDDLDRLLDEVGSNELIHRLNNEAPGNWVSVGDYECGPAALVTLGWAKGHGAVVETLYDKPNLDPGIHGV